MIADGKVARIEVSNRNVLTISGARIGMLEDEILKLYTNRVKVTQHPYDPSGHYLTIYPHAPRRLVFATDGRVVTDFVAGKAPEVDFVEGCL